MLANNWKSIKSIKEMVLKEKNLGKARLMIFVARE